MRFLPDDRQARHFRLLVEFHSGRVADGESQPEPVPFDGTVPEGSNGESQRDIDVVERLETVFITSRIQV